MHEYKDHVINQGLTLLKAHENIRCLFTTPKLLEALCGRIPQETGHKGIFCGGTQMTRQFQIRPRGIARGPWSLCQPMATR